MVLSDSLLIVGISLFTAFLGEGVTWFLVYRTEKYVKLKAEIEKQTRKRELEVKIQLAPYHSIKIFDL